MVLSIIAVLISLLMPALKKARRSAMLITCSSNLRQVGIGLGAYVTDNNGSYPEPGGYLTFYQEAPTVVDNRDAMVEIAGNRGAWLYFCPLSARSISYPHKAENSPFPSDPYAEHFFVWPWAGQFTYGGTYEFLFLLKFRGVFFTWDWSGSGNRDGGPPYDPYEPQNAIIVDQNSSSPSRGDTWQDPGDVAHSGPGGRYEGMLDSNALYADGRVETHRRTQNYVIRGGTVYYAW